MNHRAGTHFTVLISIGFLIIVGNLFRMQVLQGPYYQNLSERNRVRVVYLEAPRGRIWDREGRLLASNRLSFNCSVIPWEARSAIDSSCRIVGPLLGMEPEALKEKFLKKKPGFFNTVVLAEDINPAQAMAIEERLDSLPGFLIETRPQREYPYGEAAAHVIGYIGPMNPKEAKDLGFYGYRRLDWIGRGGVEKTYEGYLRGRAGGLQIEVDSRGRLVKALGVKEPVEGRDIKLTIDAELQSHIHQFFEGRKGAVVVMELEEGGLLAVNSSPSFDPNLFASLKGRAEVGRYLRDKLAPLINRGIKSRYPPGSIFKIVTALAAFQEEIIDETTSFTCPGYLRVGGRAFHCWRESGHGAQDLRFGLAHSCNVYFYNIGVKAGVDAIASMSKNFRLNAKTGVDLPEEKPGFVPDAQWKRRTFKDRWYAGETANFAIGQGYLQLVPIRAMTMAAAAATRGLLFKPHVIDEIAGVKAGERKVTQIDIEDEAQWRAVQAGLEEVVNGSTGTGRLARVRGLRAAGKTGTAQSGQSKTHAWFVGYAPVEDPKVALVICLEQGGRGGVEAARFAKSVFQWLQQAGYFTVF